MEHKIRLIEEIASDVEAYFIAWDGLLSKVASITKLMQHNQKTTSFTDKQLAQIIEEDSILQEAWKEKESISSKLRLCKAKKTADKLVQCSKAESKLRDILFFTKEYPNYDEICISMDEQKKFKKEFYNELANFYEQI